MRLLLDTCSFLWLAAGDRKLSQSARTLCADPDNELFLSSVTAWEIARKWQAGRLGLGLPPREFVPHFREAHGIEALPITEAAALHAASLPDVHRDPFDRMLICQAIEHGLTILTPDRQISSYPVRCAW